MIFFVLAAALWGLGWALNVPKSLRWAGIAALWLGVVAVHLTLPEGAGLRISLGGDAKTWAAAGVVALAIAGYRAALLALRRRAAPKAPTAQTGLFAAGELPRYARHIVLREIGGAGQARLKSAKVLVVGAGGLGAPALMYLAAAGVGTIGVMDDDIVDETNLARQIIHSQDHIGLPKVQSAQMALAQINPFTRVLPFHRRLNEASLSVIDDFDLVLDGSDNMATRYLVNAACARAGKPLISAALTQWEGQISLYHPPRTPCFACVFPAAPESGLAPPCAEAGVLSPLPGVIGAMMAVEAVKHISGAGQTLAGRMMLYDALDAQTRTITLTKNPQCPVCSQMSEV
jgi:molybdopterin/thiamine biosynthesis adenylyltransferase